MALDVFDFEWDEGNQEHLARHGLSPGDITEVLSNDNVFADNPRGAEGTIRMIGKTNGNRLLTVVLQPTTDRGRWRPVTGWPATGAEKTAYAQATR